MFYTDWYITSILIINLVVSRTTGQNLLSSKEGFRCPDVLCLVLFIWSNRFVGCFIPFLLRTSDNGSLQSYAFYVVTSLKAGTSKKNSGKSSTIQRGARRHKTCVEKS